jgi:hypothetical protein
MRTFVRRAVMPSLVISMATMMAAPRALAAPGDITLASTSDAGVKGNDFSYIPSLSADGTKVALPSQATNLDPADTDSFVDIYVKDLASGDITLASTSDAGVKGNGHSDRPGLSNDGMKVAFISNASNLDPADTDGIYDVYLKDLATGDITLASASDAGVKGNGDCFDPSVSDDGIRVAFWCFATNLDPADTDTTADVYVKDLATGDITLASTSDAGVKGSGLGSLDPSLSADGTKVAFFSFDVNLDPGDTDTAFDVYVKDVVTGDITLASASDAGVKGNSSSFSPSLSASGNGVAFASVSTNLDPGDTDINRDVYVKDLVTGDITLASTSDAGVKGNGDSDRPGLSADGTSVTFQSLATSLDPADADTTIDVYVKHLATGDIVLASTSDGGVKGNGDSLMPTASADGTSVTFQSFATNLDPGDTDSTADVYVKELGVAPPEQCTLTGTEANDFLKDTREDDVICGLGGDDTILGLGGDDLLLGGEGRDTLIGGSGDDILRGEGGNDTLIIRDGVRGNDTADGGDGFDRCIIDRGDVVIACP